MCAGLTSLDISADSTVAITGSEDMTARISNIHTGRVLGTFSGDALHPLPWSSDDCAFALLCCTPSYADPASSASRCCCVYGTKLQAAASDLTVRWSCCCLNQHTSCRPCCALEGIAAQECTTCTRSQACMIHQ